jgi:hypothetical protein
MHPWVFLFANHDRLRSRRIGDIQCLKSWELHPLHTLVIFDDVTHSKGDPNTTHLTFTKVQMWERMVRVSPQGHLG